MNKKIVLAILLPLVLGACASKVHRGVVAMKIDDSTAHVGIQSSEVSVGDHVELYGNKCLRIGKLANELGGECSKVSKGHGVVTRVLNQDYTAVKFDAGVTFQEGDFIEKHSH